MNLKKVFKFQNQNRHSCADLIPWFEQVSPGIILNQNGSLLAGFTYDGLDIESSSDEEHKTAAEFLENALAIFDDRFIYWTYLHKRNIDIHSGVQTENKVVDYINKEWYKSLKTKESYEISSTIYISFQPFNREGGFFDEVKSLVLSKNINLIQSLFKVLGNKIFFRDKINNYEEIFESHIIEFENKLSTFLNNLEILSISRIKDNYLLSDLSNHLNLATYRNNISIPVI